MYLPEHKNSQALDDKFSTMGEDEIRDMLQSIVNSRIAKKQRVEYLDGKPCYILDMPYQSCCHSAMELLNGKLDDIFPYYQDDGTWTTASEYVNKFGGVP